MSRRQATLFSLIGEMTALSTMWESWRNARMAWSTPWRATLAMLAGSRVIQWGAAQSTVTVYLPIRKKAKEYQRFYSSGSFALHIPCAVPAMIVSSASSKVSKSASNFTHFFTTCTDNFYSIYFTEMRVLLKRCEIP